MIPTTSSPEASIRVLEPDQIDDVYGGMRNTGPRWSLITAVTEAFSFGWEIGTRLREFDWGAPGVSPGTGPRRFGHE